MQETAGNQSVDVVLCHDVVLANRSGDLQQVDGLPVTRPRNVFEYLVLDLMQPVINGLVIRGRLLIHIVRATEVDPAYLIVKSCPSSP